MADAFDLFRSLSAGAKFDHKRFKEDWEKFKPTQAIKHELGNNTISEALDFFGNCNSHLYERKEKKRSKTKRKHSDINAAKVKEDNEHKLSVSDSRKKKKRKKSKGEQGDEEFDFKDMAVQIFSGQSKNLVNSTKDLNKEKTAEVHQEKVNLFRHEHHIYTKGSDIPDPLKQFSDLQKRFSFPDYVMNNIREMGYSCPTAVQMQAIPLMLCKRDILCCAPTGSGKTLAFILPILYHLKSPQKSGFRAVIVSPTRELAQQIYREFCHMSKGIPFRIHVLTKSKASSNSFGPKSSQKLDILVTTPNRLVHLLNQEPPGISLKNVEWLVLDEADKLFEEGKDGFREQVASIYQACDKPNIHHALFSATLSNGIEEWSWLHLDNCVRIIVGVRNSATETVEQELLFVGQEAGKLLALRDIVQKGFKPPMLVFVQSKERARELFHELIYDGISVDVIHSERTQAQRDNIVKCFRTGKIWVLITTELMGRGIDFKGVNLVINYDFPSTSVAYIHRIGRTGRAGRAGKAITFFTEDDVVNLRSIANVMRNSGCEIPDWMLKVQKPSRKTQKRLAKVPVRRKTIKTASKYDIQRSKRKRQIIEGSKQKKKSKTGAIADQRRTGNTNV